MFHDNLMKDAEDHKRWHEVYKGLADAVGVSLAKFLETLEAAQKTAYATRKDVHVVLLLLMYDFAESIDGVTILVRSGSSKNCSQLLRTAFELALSLRFILDDEQFYEQRALAYEYYHLLADLKWAQRCHPKHPVGHHVRKELEQDEFPDMLDIRHPGIDIDQELKRREATLASPRYEVVRAEIKRIEDERKKDKRTKAPFRESAGSWFSLWGGPKDIRSLAQRLKMLGQYEILYRTWSTITHGEGALKRILGPGAEEDQVNFEPLRSPVGLHEKCTHACNLTNGLTLRVVDKIVPNMRDELRTWYIEKMKPARTFIENVVINHEKERLGRGG